MPSMATGICDAVSMSTCATSRFALWNGTVNPTYNFVRFPHEFSFESELQDSVSTACLRLTSRLTISGCFFFGQVHWRSAMPISHRAFARQKRVKSVGLARFCEFQPRLRVKAFRHFLWRLPWISIRSESLTWKWTPPYL